MFPAFAGKKRHKRDRSFLRNWSNRSCGQPTQRGSFFKSFRSKEEIWENAINRRLSKVKSAFRCQHFQMETLKMKKELITPKFYFASVVLKDAYLYIEIADDGSRDLPCFRWETKMYRIKSLMFGLNLVPRVFTKLLRPVMSELRKRNIILLIYVDDILIIGSTLDSAKWAVTCTLHFLLNICFLINWEKSVLSPRQSIEWLGLILNSVKMLFRCHKSE